VDSVNKNKALITREDNHAFLNINAFVNSTDKLYRNEILVRERRRKEKGLKYFCLSLFFFFFSVDTLTKF